MKRAIKFLLLAAMLLTIGIPAIAGAAGVSTNTSDAKPGVMNSVILDLSNPIKELTPDELAAHFDNRWENAVSAGTTAIELKPKDPRAYARRARGNISKHDYEGAIADYTKAIELTTNLIGQSGWFNNRGIAKRAKGDFDGAIADMTKAVELDPDHFSGSDPFFANTYNSCGFLKLSKGDFDGAIADFNKAIEITPAAESSPYNVSALSALSAYNKRGSAKRFKGDLDGAIADYTKIIELKAAADKWAYPPADLSARGKIFYYTAAYYNRGLVKAGKGDLAGAKADFTAALKLNPGLSEAQMRLDELNQK